VERSSIDLWIDHYHIIQYSRDDSGDRCAFGKICQKEGRLVFPEGLFLRFAGLSDITP
jgi:hypothetical protein